MWLETVHEATGHKYSSWRGSWQRHRKNINIPGCWTIFINCKVQVSKALNVAVIFKFLPLPIFRIQSRMCRSSRSPALSVIPLMFVFYLQKLRFKLQFVKTEIYDLSKNKNCSLTGSIQWSWWPLAESWRTRRSQWYTWRTAAQRSLAVTRKRDICYLVNSSWTRLVQFTQAWLTMVWWKKRGFNENMKAHHEWSLIKTEKWVSITSLIFDRVEITSGVLATNPFPRNLR